MSWIPTNQDPTGSQYNGSENSAGVAVYGSYADYPSKLYNNDEVYYGNAIKTQMGNAINNYMGGYMANYSPYYIATVLGGYQQTILGLKSEIVYGYKWEYKGTGKVEYNSAAELSEKLGLTSLIHSGYEAISSLFNSTTEEEHEEIVGGDFGITIAGVANEAITERSSEGVSAELVLDNQSIDTDVQEQTHASLNIASGDTTITGGTLTATTGLIILG